MNIYQFTIFINFLRYALIHRLEHFVLMLALRRREKQISNNFDLRLSREIDCLQKLLEGRCDD